MRLFRAALASVGIAAIAVACGSSGVDILSEGERGGGAPASSVPASSGPGEATTKPAPSVSIAVPDVIAGVVGVDARLPIAVDTADGLDPDLVEIVHGPPGMVGVDSWTPTSPGRWSSELVVIDSAGDRHVRPVTFEARYRANPADVVAMGDSIASGHGLDLLDYLGTDPCFRSKQAYPYLVHGALKQAGALPAASHLAVVACSGMRLADVIATPVDGGLPGTAPIDVEALSQLEWTIRANPGIVLVSAGINDIGFVEPERLVTPSGELDRDAFGSRLDGFASGLSSLIGALVDQTDAQILVTGYYNPTASRPHGTVTCPGQCFLDVTNEAVALINERIVDAADIHERVHYVDLAEPFAGHAAPNGLGPDALRAGEYGALGDLLGQYFEAIQPYCGNGDSAGEPWLNSLDCVHPTKEGARQIAAAVLAVLDDAVF